MSSPSLSRAQISLWCNRDAWTWRISSPHGAFAAFTSYRLFESQAEAQSDATSYCILRGWTCEFEESAKVREALADLGRAVMVNLDQGLEATAAPRFEQAMRLVRELKDLKLL